VNSICKKYTLKTELIKKFQKIQIDFEDKTLKAIDIGVFPWTNSLEVSFLVDGDDSPLDDIAAWKYYDYTGFSEGKWEELKSILDEVKQDYEKKGKEYIFKEVAKIFHSKELQDIMNLYPKNEDFIIQILDSDEPSSVNYYLQKD